MPGSKDDLQNTNADNEIFLLFQKKSSNDAIAVDSLSLKNISCKNQNLC
jgi:hypothetical protein